MSAEFIPSNRLEELLILASYDAGLRPALSKELLESKLLCVVERAGGDQRIRSWNLQGRVVVPVFTSLPRLQVFMQDINRRLYHYVEMTGKQMFHNIRAMHAFLNPASDYSREFYPEEIAELLEGSGPVRILRG
jgi:hypothetical protein